MDGDEDGENVGKGDGEVVRSIIVRSSMCDESVLIRDEGCWGGSHSAPNSSFPTTNACRSETLTHLLVYFFRNREAACTSRSIANCTSAASRCTRSTDDAKVGSIHPGAAATGRRG